MPTMLILIPILVTALVAAWAWMYPLQERLLAYRNLRGPAPTHWLFGSLLDINNTPIATRGLLGRWRIVSTDLVAVSHVLRYTSQFHRHPSFNGLIERIVGPGVLALEDEPHRKQRRVLNSAFNGTSVGGMMGMMWEEARALKEHLDGIVGEEITRVDMLQSYIGTALDVIGRAGFNYRFDSHTTRNPLGGAFNRMINASLENKMVSMVQQVFPAALNWPTSNKATVDESRRVADDIGRQIVADRKAEIARDHISLEKSEYEGRDVISLCLRANMLANERDQMNDDEVLGQIGTLMLAGNETSATALSWATWHFVQRKDIQDKLREELLAVDEDPDADALNALPYLDKFVRELLRFDPPLPQVVRTSAVDCVVPLGTPVVGRDGSLITELHLPKGTDFVVPINNINRLESIWGPDANEFNPDRYDDTAYPKVSVPGVWGGLLSFIGGPHHCLGYRFAILEIKAVLFVMLRNFVFEPLADQPEITRVAPGIVQRPVIAGEARIQLPVGVRRLE